METSLLAGWDNFYVIVGSAAGGLSGLTFVVIALVRDANRVAMSGLRTFVTPTIVHFTGVLAIAAYLSMPHQVAASVSAGLGVAGIAGLLYTISICREIGRQPGYEPVWEDWIWNAIVPVSAYGALLAAAVTLWYWPQPSLYAVAGASLLVLFTGIHNAWDIAIWMTVARADPKSPAAPPPASEGAGKDQRPS